MAIYRFKISFEDYTNIVREIDIQSHQTFETLHQAIHSTTGYNPEKSSSFYVSNDQWLKKDEITYLPTQRKVNQGVKMMEATKLNQCIDDPHQKFYYTYNFEEPIDFHVELIKILLNDQDDFLIRYPRIVKRIGEAPRLTNTASNPVIVPPTTSDDFDFLNDVGLDLNDAEEMETMQDMGINTKDEEDTLDEQTGRSNIFSMDEAYDEDDLPKNED